MLCPFCHFKDTQVIDSRVIEEGAAIRRRRECPHCGFRFSTIEEIEILTMTVVKRDGSAEMYNKEKLTKGLRIALRRRPVSPVKLRQTVNKIEQQIQTTARQDRISSEKIGQIVMKFLRKLDKVAYIRFASVYCSFQDISEFAEALKEMQSKKGRSKKA